jgi:tetratricopeptide (TPR) repeat protein
MKQLKPLILFSLLFFAMMAKAQMPILKVSNSTQKQPVTLQKLAIDVQIVGNVATTVMTMTFYNNDSKVLEGELTFPMPEGVTVSRYALDIDGKMREAVPVEKAKATAVFESIQHVRVDPGLLEKVEGNNFRTRIYPIPSKGTRTIIVGYEEELKFTKNNTLRYHLPLDFDSEIAKFSLKTTIFENMMKPELVEQPDGSFNFSSANNVVIGEMKKENFIPKKSLTINLPKRSDMPEVLLQKAENSYYFLVNVFPKSEKRKRQWNNQIGLIWDCSLSGLQRDHKKEMELLELIVKQKQNLTIQLGLLNNRFQQAGTFVILNGDWSALKKKLENIVYDGGTDFSAVNQAKLNANEYLFFSDGLSTFGANKIGLSKPVYTINTSSKADYSNLKYISLKTGGQFVNLATMDAAAAFEQFNEEPLRYLGIKNRADVRQTYPSLPVAVDGHLSVAGILGNFGNSITLQFGYGNTVTSEQTIVLTADQQQLNGINVSRVWAQKKIAEMDILYEENKDDISALSKQFGIVTRNTSLMVLENLSDYVRYTITPPAELLVAYNAVLKQDRATLLSQQKNLLNDAIAMGKELKIWWNTDFYSKVKENKNHLYPHVSTDRDVAAARDEATTQRRRAEVQLSNAPPRVQNSAADNKELNEVVVTRAYGYASGSPGAASALAGRVAGLKVKDREEIQQPVMVVKEFKSDKDYMKQLTGKGEEVYQQYLALRTAYLNTPTFYFDVANLLFQQADSTRALMVLSNIADLDLENADLFKLLAFKLKQTGNYQEALFVTKKVMEWRPMDPQSHRDYALALADLGQYQQALDILYGVLLQSYNEHSNDRDDGIEEIIIAEINNLIAKQGNKLNHKKIDQRIILPLPVDIRVVLSWNKKDTDIDLWLTDPKGEKCFYSNPSTQIGGRISNDFTDGYGPEQFMLKKAVKGKYKIEVNYYGDRQFTVSGPTTVTAEIYTRYATGKQERKIIVLPLENANANGNLIGEFVF